MHITRTRVLLAALAAGAALVALVPGARASHSHNGWNQLHVSTIHDNTPGTSAGQYDEEYCIQSSTSSVSSTALANHVQAVLTQRPGRQWDGAASYRVDLWRTAKFCNQYDANRRQYIEIEYLVADGWPNVPLCGNTTYSCTVLTAPRMDPSGDHQHYRKAVIHFQARHVAALDEDRARSFINHETGHALGLADPPHGSCVSSVMHNQFYSCGYNNSPTANDLASVANIAARRN